MVLIGLLGKKRAGKDTLADYLVQNHQYTKISIADPLKQVCKILFGFTTDQLYGNSKEVVDDYWNITPREAYQFIGTDIFRNSIEPLIPNIKDTFWLKCFYRKFKNENLENENIVIADLRFQNEVDLIHELGGVVYKIVRPNLEYSDNHESEKGIDDINNFNDIIINDKDLQYFIKSFENKLNNICKL